MSGETSGGDAEQVGAQIRALRRSFGLSQSDLAGEDISPSYVSLLEAGRRKPTRHVLEILARRLNTTVADLRGEGPGGTTAVATAKVETQLDLRWARIALHNGDSSEATPCLERVLADPDITDRERLEAQVLLAAAHENAGHLMDAITLLEEISPELSSTDAQQWVAAQTHLCRCYKHVGDLDRAVDVGEAVLHRREVAGTEVLAVLAVTLGGAYYERGDLKRATVVLSDVLSYAKSSGSHRARGGALWNSSLVAAAEERFDQALIMAERALAIFGESDNTRNLARLKVAYAWLTLETAPLDLEPTRRLLLHAQIDLEAEGTPVDLAACLTELARCDLLAGDFDAACATATRAVSAVDGQLVVEGARATAVLGQSMVLDGDTDGGMRLLHASAVDLEQLGARREAARVWRDLAELASHFGLVRESDQAMDRAAAAMGIVPRSIRALLTRHGANLGRRPSARTPVEARRH